MPKISVLLPVYNAAAVFPRAVATLLNQTEKDLEVVVVDDGSTDDVFHEIKAIHNSRIRYFRIPRGGVSRALNYGLARCRGEYIARMDADDLCHPDRMNLQSRFLDEHPDVGLVSCLVAHLTEEGRPTRGYERHIHWLNELITPEQHALNRFVDAPVAHPSVMFRRTLTDEYGGYSEEEEPEDFELWLRWMDKGIGFAKIPKILFSWSDHPLRLSRTHANYSQEAFYRVKARYFEKWYVHHGQERAIWIWGLGRSVNKRVRSMRLPVAGFIDVKDHREAQIISYREIDQLDHPLVLSYVSDWKGKVEIRKYLEQLGKKEGEDFWMMA